MLACGRSSQVEHRGPCQHDPYLVQRLLMPSAPVNFSNCLPAVQADPMVQRPLRGVILLTSSLNGCTWPSTLEFECLQDGKVFAEPARSEPVKMMQVNTHEVFMMKKRYLSIRWVAHGIKAVSAVCMIRYKYQLNRDNVSALYVSVITNFRNRRLISRFKI